MVGTGLGEWWLAMGEPVLVGWELWVQLVADNWWGPGPAIEWPLVQSRAMVEPLRGRLSQPKARGEPQSGRLVMESRWGVGWWAVWWVGWVWVAALGAARVRVARVEPGWSVQ